MGLEKKGMVKKAYSSTYFNSLGNIIVNRKNITVLGNS